MADLSVNIGSLMMSNPVMTASGTFGYGKEFEDFVDLEKIGGIIVKGTTLHHREGNPYPRMAETPMGMLNAVGLQNKGVNYFVEHIYPQIRWFYAYVEAETTGQMDLQWQDSYILRDIRWMFFYVRENILQKNTEYN